MKFMEQIGQTHRSAPTININIISCITVGADLCVCSFMVALLIALLWVCRIVCLPKRANT